MSEQIVNGLLVLLGGIVASALALAGVRFTARQSRKATSDQSADAWNATYRSTAEEHMYWDMDIKARVERLQRELGIDDPVPSPPPLFPARPGDTKKDS